MAKYTLTLVLDNAILGSGSSDKLVIAKKVSGALTTVFTGASPVPAPGFQQLQKSNVFSWEDKYQVFGTVNFGKGVFVRKNPMTVPASPQNLPPPLSPRPKTCIKQSLTVALMG